MVIPTVGRTRAQFMEPFAKGGCFEDLWIENFELFHGEDRIWTQFEASGDAHAFWHAMGCFLPCFGIPDACGQPGWSA
jgi:hypothetical protein